VSFCAGRRRLGVDIDRGRGKDGHVMARLGGRFAMVPTGSGDYRPARCRRFCANLACDL